MSKQYSQFDVVGSLLSNDRILVGRVDGASPSGFSNFLIERVDLIPNAIRVVGAVFDGGGGLPTVPTIVYIRCPFDGVIDRWDIIGDDVGDAVIDVWKAAGSIPTIADTITGTEKPTLTGQQLNSDDALTTWNDAVLEGDIIGFVLVSVATCKRIVCELQVLQPL